MIRERLGWIRDLSEALSQETELSSLEVDAFISRVTGSSRAAILSGGVPELSVSQSKEIEEFISRRRAHEPLSYILGEREFYSRTFLVSGSVLIPRPETELLVDRALEILRSDIRPTFVCEIGVGSGAPIISILGEVANEIQNLRIVGALGTDISECALEVAGQNRERLLPPAVLDLEVADLLPVDFADRSRVAGAERVLIIANPPYIEDSYTVSPEVGWEPKLALFAGPKGLDLYSRLFPRLRELNDALPEGRELHGLIEIGHSQGPAVSELASNAGFRVIAIHRDLAGLDRVVEINSRSSRSK